MMKSMVLPTVATVVLASCVTVEAQQAGSYGYGDRCHGPHNYYPYGRAATAAEAQLRGIAAATYAQGQYNRMTAQARVHAERARQMRIRNHELAVRTRLSMQEANREARASARRPRITSEQAARLAAAAKPDRLSPNEFDPWTGQIVWPGVLQAEEFDRSRQQMESLLARRRPGTPNGGYDTTRANGVIKTILAILKDQIREIPPSDYMAARRFIESLAYEVRQPAENGTATLAMSQPSR